MTIVTCPSCGTKNRVDETRTDLKPVCGNCRRSLDVAGGAAAAAAGPAAGNGHPVELTDASFERELRAAGDRPVLVDAWATWCPPCRAIAPTIAQLAAESAGRWVVAKLDVDANPATAQRFRISSIPTLLVFRGGKLVDQMVGVQPKHAIEARLQAHAA
jgi:thioredoxin